MYLSTFGRTVNTSTGFFAYLWQDYAKADARWGFSEPTVVALEILTVLGAGPLAAYCAYLLSKNVFSYHYWVVVLSTAELYGGFMTFAPEWLSGNKYLNGSNWMLMWVYLFFMNMVWVVIPLYLLYDSFRAITLSTNAGAVSYLTASPQGSASSSSSSASAKNAKQGVIEIADPKPTGAVDALDTTKAIQNASEADENVFLFVPNLIGYTRVVLAALSLYYMQIHPKACTFLYGVSCLLDAVDGLAARKLGQSTKFGAVLDMVTDRCTTACLLCYLTKTYPRAALLFQALITLDFSSHYIHMYSTLLTGAASHKLVTEDVSRILWYYYNDSVSHEKSDRESQQLLTDCCSTPPPSALCSSSAPAMSSSSSASTSWNSTRRHSALSLDGSSFPSAPTSPSLCSRLRPSTRPHGLPSTLTQ